MARIITIAGIDRTADILLDDFSIEQALTSDEDSFSFTVWSGAKPTTGQEVIVTQDDIKYFAGIIDRADDDPIGGGITFYKCQARDYTFLLDRKLVVETYENLSASDIFLNIASLYCTDFTVTGVQPNAPTVEYIRFDYVSPSECFKELCKYVGWEWYPDYDKDLHFFESFAELAPVVLTAGVNFRNLARNIEIEGLRNRVYVLGGTFLSDFQMFEYVADGAERVWTLPYEPHSPTVSVSEGTPVQAGLENVDDESLYAWMYNQREKFIRCSAQTATPVNGATVAFTFKYPMPVVTMRDDEASQAAIAAVQGGDGVYEHKINDDSLTTLEAAEAAADSDLRDHANPAVDGSFDTEYVSSESWQPEIEQLTTYSQSNINSGRWYAQGFKPAGSLIGANKIRFQLLSFGKSSTPPDTHWHVYDDDGGKPGNSISTVGYAVLAGADWAASGQWIVVEIDLDTPLAAGVQYWVVTQGQGEYSGANVAYCHTALDNPYADGYVCYTYNQGALWYQEPNWDRTFRIDALLPVKIWVPGQLLTINLPAYYDSEHGITGDFLIQKVTITPLDASNWTYRVKYGGRLLGVDSYLVALLSAQQNKATAEVEYQTKFETAEDLVGILDEATVTPRTTPWYCGDVDAICGEVVCLEVP